MTPEQQDFLGLIELLLTQISTDKVYRHIREKIGDHEIFIEDTVTHVLLLTKAHGTIIDIERSPKGPIFYSWKEDKAAEIMVLLKHYYILDMLAGI